MVALTHLTKLLLPMLQRHQGKILNVSSTAAFQPGPMMAVYYATKAYVLSVSEALANKLSGVTVTALVQVQQHQAFQKTSRNGTIKVDQWTADYGCSNCCQDWL